MPNIGDHFEYKKEYHSINKYFSVIRVSLPYIYTDCYRNNKLHDKCYPWTEHEFYRYLQLKTEARKGHPLTNVFKIN